MTESREMTESDDEFLKRIGDKTFVGSKQYIEDMQRLYKLARRGAETKAAWKGPGTHPHKYVPDTSQYAGDCAICGHTQEAHRTDR